MAVTKTFSRKPYIGTGSAVEFSFASKVFALTDVSVIVKNLTTGIETTLTVDVDYTIVAISGNLDNGVTIDTTGGSTPVTYTTNDQITLIRSISETQTLELEEGGDMPANELEDALDRGIMISQQILDGGERHITHPATDPISTTYNVPTSELRADKVLGYDSFGNVTTLTPTDIGSVAADNAAGVEILNTSTEADDVTIEINIDSKYAIKDLGVDTAQLAAGAVTTAKIGADAVDGTKLADNAVDTEHITDDSVTNAKLDDVGKWVSWTPVIDQGATSNIAYTENLAAKYCRIGDTIHATIDIEFTGTGASGAVECNVPVSSITGTRQMCGTGYYADISGANIPLIPFFLDEDTLQFVSTITSGAIGTDPAIIVAATDLLRFIITYEVA